MNDRQDIFGNLIIDHFRNDFDYLSNFYNAPIHLWGVHFPTSEHAYQWSKTFDPIEKTRILHNYSDVAFTTPGQAKQWGNSITLRADWKDVRYRIMLEILYAKFTQHWGLKQNLLNTGEALLIEGNHWCDNIWGSCRCPKCGDKGQNMLGMALMQLREWFLTQELSFGIIGPEAKIRDLKIIDFATAFPLV